MGIYVGFTETTSSGNYHNTDAVDKVIKYILKKESRCPDKYNVFGSIGTYHNKIPKIIEDFKKVKKIHEKNDGVQIKHLIISFENIPDISPQKLEKLIIRVLKTFSHDFQLVYAVHEDTDNLHIHVGINSVSFTGKKFDFVNSDMWKFQKRVKRIFKDYI